MATTQVRWNRSNNTQHTSRAKLFAKAVARAVEAAVALYTVNISQIEPKVFGTAPTVPKGFKTSRIQKQRKTFTSQVSASHSDCLFRHLIQRNKHSFLRANVGSVIEQLAADLLPKLQNAFQLDTDYLYQKSVASGSFTTSYSGKPKSAIPDFRLYLDNGVEAVIDITTPQQTGHLDDKRVGNTRLKNYGPAVIGIEVFWDTPDFLRATGGRSRSLRSGRTYDL